MKRIVAACLAYLLVGCGQSSGARLQAATPHARYQVNHAALPGPLFLIGGGDDAPPLLRRFMALAGGVDAPVVIVPFAGGDVQGEMARSALTAQGATNLSVLGGRTETLEADRKLLAGAAGIFFSGGTPAQLLTRYMPYMDVTRAAWQAGCVVGGSSAGAMVWGSQVIVKGETPEALAHGIDKAAGGLDVMPGLGLLGGAIVDPHFGARSRFNRLWVASGNAGLLGIGIDEQTAAYIPSSGPLEAAGTGAVTLIRAEGGAGTPARVTVVAAGHRLAPADWQLFNAR